MFDKTKTVAWMTVIVLACVAYLAYKEYKKPATA